MLLVCFAVVVLVVCLYALRHYLFTLNRLFSHPHHSSVNVDTADWPKVTVLIAAHNEEAVISDILQALIDVDYPANRMTIMPVNDRSTDRTKELIDAFIQKHPQRNLKAFHRSEGKPGKAAALKDAMEMITTPLILIFDADYLPGRALIKQLVTPFFDPEVGSVMGRVVPVNTGKNLLTRLLDLERSGGYQVNQQARMNLDLVPQYGGTVGGVRMSALAEAGGWNIDTLTEDTDLTYSLLLHGWKTVYLNHAECYEEVPEQWPVRVRQIRRWATGHNQAMAQYGLKTLLSSQLSLRQRIDGLLLLGVYAAAPILMAGWIIALILFYRGLEINGLLLVLFFATFSTLGNFATFFEIATAVRLDGSRERIRLLPWLLLSFIVSLVSVSRACVRQIINKLGGPGLVWHKTDRFRQAAPALAPTLKAS
jgi:cellulose synthase/poly-beta-1,6-N-acetylglucosamine synthase-like glycosyltransferase